jgi:hypothetical protein
MRRRPAEAGYAEFQKYPGNFSQITFAHSL